MKKVSPRSSHFYLFTVSCLLTHSLFGAQAPLTLSNAIFENVPFTPKSNYLQRALPFEPAAQLRKQVASAIKVDSLDHRGEAHITLITPPEYTVLSQVKDFGIEQINEIAKSMKVQELDFKIKCVGRSVGKKGHKKEGWEVYYVVVKPKPFVKIRKAILNAYVKAGGEPSHFDPKAFHPHITLGFTENDIYSQDGVFKGSNSCAFDLEMTDR